MPLLAQHTHGNTAMFVPFRKRLKIKADYGYLRRTEGIVF